MGELQFEEALVSTNNIQEILAQEGIGYLLSSLEEKVPFPSSEQKTICLLFSSNWSRPCKTFIPQLVQVYNTLKDTGQELEIIFVSFDRDEKGFREHFKCMPWLAVPFNLNLQRRLGNLWGISHIPSLVPLGVDAKLLANDAVGLIKDYGADAFPFTKKRQEELKALDEAKRQGGNLDELFTNGTRQSFISSTGVEISASQIVGKTIGLYFGAHWCPPCHKFTAQLTEAYNDIITNIDQGFANPSSNPTNHPTATATTKPMSSSSESPKPPKSETLIDESQNPEPEPSDPTSEAENHGGGEEEAAEEEGECPFCAFMKGGGCRETFIRWEDCVKEGEENKEDIVEKCFEITSRLKECMDKHADYYAPVLQAEKAAEEEVKKQLESESESAEGSSEKATAGEEGSS